MYSTKEALEKDFPLGTVIAEEPIFQIFYCADEVTFEKIKILRRLIMGDLHDYAVKEMNIAWPEPDPMQDAIKKDILEIVDAFSAQGHSGVSAPYCIAILERVLRYKPITPLTGEDSEWGEPFYKDDMQQNLRCSSVFRKHYDNATAHDNNGKVFSDDGGKTFYLTRDSRVPITFPYYPPESAERVILENSKGADEE